MLRKYIAATSLNILLKNLYSVKCYDKSNTNVFTLSQWENFGWGLIYFDQFINIKCHLGRLFISLRPIYSVNHDGLHVTIPKQAIKKPNL